MLHFMYQGEVNIKQEDIASFLKVAETLQIKGLTTESDDVCSKYIQAVYVILKYRMSFYILNYTFCVTLLIC